MIFNAYHSHDDLVLTGVGSTYRLGRWLLQMLYDLDVKIMGSHINAKGFVGIVSFFLSAVICCIIAEGLKLKKNTSLVLLSAVVITFPYVTSLFGYGYTASYYNLSMIMALIAALLIQKEEKFKDYWWKMLLGIILLGLSIAIYQASLCTFVIFLVLMEIRNTLSNENELWKSFLQRCAKYLVGCAAACLFYLITNKIVLDIKHITLSNYQGLDNMTNVTVTQIVQRVVLAYKEFFFPSDSMTYGLYYTQPIRWCYRLVVLMMLIYALFFIVQALGKKQRRKALQLALLFLLVPLGANSILVITNPLTANIHSLMQFAKVMVFVALISAIEYLDDCLKINKVVIAGRSLSVLLLVYTAVYHSYTANVCYAKAAIQQEHSIGYLNRLVARIQSVDGYSVDLPVAYINEYEKSTAGVEFELFDDHCRWVTAYHMTSVINLYNWREYMSIWCGYSPEVLSDEEVIELEKMPMIKEMPNYPNDGSIKIINGTIVVKFAD